MAQPASPLAPMPRLTLGVHGLAIAVSSEWDAVLDAVRADFTWFAAPNTRPRPSGSRSCPPRPTSTRLDGPASFVTPRNVVYQAGGRTVIDYFGKAVSVLDRPRAS